MIQKCFEGHDVVYQPFSGGKYWWCEICECDGPYDYGNVDKPRAWLLMQSDGAKLLRMEIDLDEI